MKLYSAGVFNTISDIRIDWFQKTVGFDYPILESYHYKRSVDRAIKYNISDLFLDSGAFSAMSLDVTIDINKYIDYILLHKEAFTVIASLDVIGDPDMTIKNIEIMKAAGIAPLPVFHYLTPLHYLDLCKEFDYFALGGLVPIAAQLDKLTHWLDKCWNLITDTQGAPTHKVHGFGMTGVYVMSRYPWYSVDSSSWLRGGQGGAILLHEIEKIRTIVIANNSPAIKDTAKHYDSMSLVEQQCIEQTIEHNDFTVNQLRTDHWSRRAFNIQQSNNWARARKEPVFIKQEQSLL